MPKAYSPLFSSIRGTLKGGATFRANPQTDAITMQTKPVPTGTPTAKQAAIRAAYSRLAYLWSNLSYLDKEPYELLAEQKRITSWNAFLSFHMPIMAQTPKFYTAFAEGSGTIIQDFAIGGLTGTKTGPTWTTKNGIPCLSFDGIDDIVSFNRPGYYDNSTDFTFFTVITIDPTANYYGFLMSTRSSSSQNTGIAFYLTQIQKLQIIYGNNVTRTFVTSDLPVTKGIPAVAGVIKSGKNLTFYLNGTTISKVATFGEVTPSPNIFSLGKSSGNDFWYKGLFHVAAMFHKALPLSTLHSLQSAYVPLFA